MDYLEDFEMDGASSSVQGIMLIETPRELECSGEDAYAQECIQILNQKLEDKMNW